MPPWPGIYDHYQEGVIFSVGKTYLHVIVKVLKYTLYKKLEYKKSLLVLK